MEERPPERAAEQSSYSIIPIPKHEPANGSDLGESSGGPLWPSLNIAVVSGQPECECQRHCCAFPFFSFLSILTLVIKKGTQPNILTRHKSFGPVLKNWMAVSKEYACAWKPNDAHWSYRERAHISMLAAAIWRTGGVALEEYGTKKTRSKKLYSGRCDLCFKLRKSRQAQGYIAEAKHYHIRLPKLDGLRLTLERAKESALQNLTSVTTGEIGLGVVFLTFRARGPKADGVGLAVAELQKLHKELKSHSTAWQFPDWAKETQDTIYRYPGTAVFIFER